MSKIDFYEEEQSALPGSFSRYDMECIYPALKSMKKDDIYLEVGVQYGRSLDFARQHSKGDVFGVDVDNHDINIKGVNFIYSNANDVDWNLPIKVLFIDGDHTYEGVKADWEKYSPLVVKGGWVFFHDCDETSPGVVKLFDEINNKTKQKSPEQRCSMAWLKI